VTTLPSCTIRSSLTGVTPIVLSTGRAAQCEVARYR
jgi:hypothetical protein